MNDIRLVLINISIILICISMFITNITLRNIIKSMEKNNKRHVDDFMAHDMQLFIVENRLEELEANKKKKK